MNFPILSTMTFLPLVGILFIALTPNHNKKTIRWVGALFTGFILLLAMAALVHFKADASGFQFQEKLLWIPAINVHYFLGVDGISMTMVILTALLAFLACIASFGIEERVKEYFILYLLLETGMLGTFCSLDLFLFYIFWEIVLVPMYFLIGIWGGPNREYAAIKFFLYTLAGSVLMLLGILALYFSSEPHTFAIPDLVKNNFGLLFQKITFLAFFAGFAIKVPIWPFHTWLPDAHVEAPTPISVILAGVLLKMGTYGFFRISYPILPDAALWFRPAMTVLAVIGIIYGALVSLAQSDFKKMIAYSSVSHMGFVLLGLSVFTAQGFAGALLQMFNHGIITGGLFLLVGVLYDRTHTRDLASLGGLGARVPVYAGLLILFSLASLGLPGLAGFVGEFLVLLGSFKVTLWGTISAAIGVLLAACYLLYMIQRVLLGTPNPKWSAIPEISARELFTLVPLVILIVYIGVWPKDILNLMQASLDAILVITE